MTSAAAPAVRACVVALALAGCGAATTSATPSPSEVAVPSASLVTPPPASSVVALDLADLTALANAHRIRTAVVSTTSITGTMASDIAPQQQFSAPKPANAGALATLMKALRDGGAAISMAPGH